jgi:hypothetical protein
MRSEWRRRASRSRAPDTAAPLRSVASVIKASSPDDDLVLTLLERAAGSTHESPWWGPPDDPVKSIHFDATWLVRPNALGQEKPILLLPIQARSAQMTVAEWNEMEDSIERTVLDPEHAQRFRARVVYDPEMVQVPLAATQRCILAALVRALTLPPGTKCNSLTDPQSIEQQWDHDQLNLSLASLLSEPTVLNPTTTSLVSAMDWHHAAEEIIKPWQAEAIVRRVMEDSQALSDPDVSVRIDQAMRQTDGKFLRCSSSPGRFLSLLFAEMSRVRTPSAIAMVWMSFIKTLRDLQARYQTVPNLHRAAESCAVNVIGQLCAEMSAEGETSPLDNQYQPRSIGDTLIGQKLLVRTDAVFPQHLLS